ncbi:MAG: hypothetical protein Q8922_09190 [Bacteroidota bacterium]|nr:hypothetical protein [Bacteroidota bacterium]MDP4234208.1 hypothetical protein [Bacteroidota bacterium]MDP4244132.1 hypothetical protein [Bacteroidota bacterium]MDP4288097.1 hypothetical protein [Bacteroidota bacterium]
MLFLRRNFPFIFIPVSFAVALLLVGGCSSTTSVSTNDGTVTMQSQLATSDVNQMVVKGQVPTDLTFSSIVVTRVQVFIKDIKLHSDVEDTSKDDHDAEIKTGPFVMVFDSTGTHVVTTVTIPAGTYDRVKFELHKPNQNDAADAAILAAYPDFVSGNQTYTVVIDGYTVSNGVRTYFRNRSISSKNFTLRFKDHDNQFSDLNNIVISGGSSMTLAFQFDPRLVFHIEGLLNGTMFDPRDTSHQKDIDDHVLIAIRLVKIS